VKTAVWASAAVAAALLGSGCGSDDGGTASPTTTAPTTTTAPSTTTAVVPPPAAGERDAADVVERVLPSVVNVRTTTFAGEQAEGSGVILDRQGIVVTNNHVVEGARRVTIAVNDRTGARSLKAEVIGTAPERDLAVLRVRGKNLVPAKLGRSASLRLGDGLLAIGFPLGLGGPTVTRGIVSGLNRTISPGNGPTLEGLLQTDAAVNPGNSGGALIDLSGRLVGINTAAAQASTAENIGFAIAIDEALPVIQEIRSKPLERRAWLGVATDTVDSAFVAAQLGLDPDVRGAVVVSVIPAGPAAEAGIREGDVIVRVGDKDIDSAEALTRALRELDPGDKVMLEVVDSLGPRRAEVTLARRPATLGG
jgi:S1-C subfamily serine protease